MTSKITNIENKIKTNQKILTNDSKKFKDEQSRLELDQFQRLIDLFNIAITIEEDLIKYGKLTLEF